MAVELSFVIVNWNGGSLLRDCIESIFEYPPAVSYEILVVDNASSDDSIDWLRSPELAKQLGTVKLTLIENSSNVGFGGANNQAFAASDSTMVFLLNSDAELRAGTCDKLISTLRSDDRIGACAPRLLNSDGSLQLSVWRNPPTAWASLVSGLRLYLLMPRRLRGELLLGEFWDHDRKRDVNMLSGAAILAKRQMIDEVGGFDSRFHMYAEDFEWCLRMVRAGWRLVFEPEALVMHHGAKSSLRRWDKQKKMAVQTVAFLNFQRLCLPRSNVIVNLLTSCFLLTLQRTVRLFRGGDNEEVEQTLKLHAADLKRALRDG
ncbi:MAG: glycosyltransferase family 2 protein [Pyrinomonadaceae bacterium]